LGGNVLNCARRDWLVATVDDNLLSTDPIDDAVSTVAYLFSGGDLNGSHVLVTHVAVDEYNT